MPPRQPVYVVCHGADVPQPPRARVFAAPGIGVGEALAALAEPIEGDPDARHRLDAEARTLARQAPWRPLVLVVGPRAARLLIAELTGASPGSVADACTRPGAVTVIGLPGAARTIGPWPVAIVALLLAIVDNLLWGQLGVPFVATGALMATSLLALVAPVARPWGVAGLKAAAIGVLLTVLLLSSVKRFPAS